jgi:hypothetical protein
VVDIVTRLRKEIAKRERPYPVELLPELQEAADEIERLRAERDEARREICMAKAQTTLHALAEYAKSRGWDCFHA